ncbi:hypothetical protein GCM10027280_17320 [Micromonospora polyrhachis]|uniref:Uncharacterized protein n=1 Tax=Micromonospora polyrhachis TaxID=1282883 RepID=A0A7W7SRI7_9ACTN|nr:hypothetical protein [Micromonospora polyrhachis]MBB4958380.1 hypothetical protein [Micromonospora polyrhachis]
MRTEGEELEAVARLWDAHLRAAFPEHLRGVDLLGVDMVMLDADIAGCVSTRLGNRGSLDGRRQRTLTRCMADLDRVLPILTGQQERGYYGRLRTMAVAVLGMQ